MIVLTARGEIEDRVGWAGCGRGGLPCQAVLAGGAAGARCGRSCAWSRRHRRRPLRGADIEVDLLTRGAPRRCAQVHAVEHRVRAAGLPAAPSWPGALARADPERGLGLRARPGDERRRRLRRLSAAQARPPRRSGADLHGARRRLPPRRRRAERCRCALDVRADSLRRDCAGAWRAGSRSWRCSARGSRSWPSTAAPATQLRHQIDQRARRRLRRVRAQPRRPHVAQPARCRRLAAPTCAASRSAPARLCCSRSSPERARATNRPELFAQARPDNGETQAEQDAGEPAVRDSC